MTGPGDEDEGASAPDEGIEAPAATAIAVTAASPDTAVAPVDDGPEPIALGEQAVLVELRDFEGPLDLLLHLVKKHELSILDIPIAFITDQYLTYLRRMEELNLDVAGEYLLMAATLAHLKSRELLPPTDEELAQQAIDAEGEEMGDPRQELIRRLLEYQKYKAAALSLGNRPVVGRNVWVRGLSAQMAAGIDGDLSAHAPLAEVPVFKLIEALEKVLSRSRVKLTHDVVVDRISISDKINQLVERLERENTFTFAACFDFLDEPDATGLRHQVVVTFLALLEMTRLKMLRMHQPADRGEIYLTRGGAELRPVESTEFDDAPVKPPRAEDADDNAEDAE